MKRLTATGILLVALASGVLSYLYAGNLTTETPAQTRPPMSHLLELSAEQERVINSADPRFLTDAAEFVAKLDAEQEKLAALLENPGSGKEEAEVELVREVAAAAASMRMIQMGATERGQSENRRNDGKECLRAPRVCGP